MEIREIRNGFTWVDNDITRSKILTSSDKVVYYALATFANNETQSCFPSNLTLEEVTGLTGRTVTESVKRLESSGCIYVKRTMGKVNTYFLLKVPTSLHSSVVKNDSETMENEHRLPPKNDTTNYTNITIQRKTNKFQPKLYPLEDCSRGVKYAVEKLGLQPTEGLKGIIDERYSEYSISPSIDTMLAWCETNQVVPTTARLSNWIKRDLDSGMLKKKRRA